MTDRVPSSLYKGIQAAWRTTYYAAETRMLGTLLVKYKEKRGGSRLLHITYVRSESGVVKQSDFTSRWLLLLGLSHGVFSVFHFKQITKNLIEKVSLFSAKLVPVSVPYL